MSGQMGNAQVSTKGLDIVRIDSERNLLFIKGSVPEGHERFRGYTDTVELIL